MKTLILTGLTNSVLAQTPAEDVTLGMAITRSILHGFMLYDKIDSLLLCDHNADQYFNYVHLSGSFFNTAHNREGT